MEKIMFETKKFSEFMYVLKDFEESLYEWAKKDISNTWGMRCEVGDGEYVIYLTVNEGKNKSK
tara:strand:- start:447 stop:635 length:189 start_codon:yes stop_codon:yes gene_type:complete